MVRGVGLVGSIGIVYVVWMVFSSLEMYFFNVWKEKL